VRLGVNSYNLNQALPDGARLTSQGEDWFRFQTEAPAEINPLVIQGLVNKHIPVVALSEVSRSLEKVYLQAINTDGGDVHETGLVEATSAGGETHAG